MKLYIDTSDNQKTIVSLGQETIERKTGPDRSQQVLLLIEELSCKMGISLREIGKIEVNSGPGSFTGLRVGAAVGNALGYALNIPVNGGKMIEPQYFKR